jgi:hypothetical protein
MTYKETYLAVYPTASCELCGNRSNLFDKYIVYTESTRSGVRNIMGWGPTPYLAWKNAVDDMGRKMLRKLGS